MGAPTTDVIDELAEVVDAGHPILADGPDRDAAVAAVRADLSATGCSVLHDFVRPELRDRLRREGERAAPSAHLDVATVNVYNTAPDPALAPDHPAHRTTERGNAFVARDRIGTGTVVEALYTSQGFRRFVADCFGLAAVHELADPLSALTLNVLAPGRGHPWHFDVNDFTVTLLTREPEAGGAFEYCPNLRSPREENLDAVRAVLGGDRRPVRTLPLRPGDLQLFRGRFALHRVSPVEGDRARHTAILAYAARPGVIGSPERTRQLFGRVTEQHTRARGPAGDGLLD